MGGIGRRLQQETFHIAQCEGTPEEVRANKKCVIKLDTLKAPPFNLQQGDTVNVKVRSKNVYGTSESTVTISDDSVVIKNVPDAPINLANDPTITSDTTVKFLWDEGFDDGGSPVIDYAVYYDMGIDSFVLLDSQVTSTFY
jgi:hypothetical protein